MPSWLALLDERFSARRKIGNESGGELPGVSAEPLAGVTAIRVAQSLKFSHQRRNPHTDALVIRTCSNFFLGLDLKLFHRGRFRNLFCRNLIDFLSLYRNRETEILKGQIDFLNDAINREEERAKELEMKSKYGSFLSPLFHFSSFAQSQHQYTIVYLNFCKGSLTL